MTITTSRAERDNNFDLLRLFGALLVIYGHSHALLGQAPPGFAANAVSTIGVKIFFCISGYLVSLSWLRDPRPGVFLVKRSLRIFPALIAIVILTTFVMGPAVTRLPLSAYLENCLPYLRNIRLYISYGLPGVFETNIYPNAVNGSLWSLPVEFAMYFIAPIAIAGTARTGGKRVFATMAIGFIGLAVWRTKIAPPPEQWVIYATSVWSALDVAPYFAAGMIYAVCGLDRRFDIHVAFAALFVIAVVDTDAVVKEALLLLVLPYACLTFGTGRSSWHRFSRGTDLSYGMFLYGFPVQQLLIHAYGPRFTPWGLFGLTVPIAGLAAFLSWHLVEKRALRWKVRRAVTSGA